MPADRDRIKIERDWLRERTRELGHFNASKPEIGGLAAVSMVEYALGGQMPAAEQFPTSPRHLQAALNTLETAPLHLQERMEEVIKLYRDQTGLEADPGIAGPLAVTDFVAMLNAGEYVAEAWMVPSGSYDSEDALLAEWQWLRERARLVGATFSRDASVRRSWGGAANSLVDYALGGDYPPPFGGDGDDLAACEEAVRTAPLHLRERMEPVIDAHRATLEAAAPSLDF
jgi:hypothetical protein